MYNAFAPYGRQCFIIETPGTLIALEIVEVSHIVRISMGFIFCRGGEVVLSLTRRLAAMTQ